MRWKRPELSSLRRRLFILLLPVLATITVAELWMTHHDALDAANAAYDRSLLGAAKSIAANISTTRKWICPLAVNSKNSNIR